MIKEALIVIIAYLVGSISLGYFFGRLVKGIDLRKVGRKNTGGTNTWVNVGAVYGIITIIFDVFKGTIMVVIALLMNMPMVVVYLVALFSVIGHNHPFYLNFKGGRGTATSFGSFVPILIVYNDIYSYIAIIIICIRSWIISPGFRKVVLKKLGIKK
jgi:glycerol-3-phosphate acyltransferase PlsY